MASIHSIRLFSTLSRSLPLVLRPSAVSAGSSTVPSQLLAPPREDNNSAILAAAALPRISTQHSPARPAAVPRQQPPAPVVHRPPPAAPVVPMDTYRIVQDLKKAGYSSSQAESLVDLMTAVLQTSLTSLTAEQVKHHQLDLLESQLRSELESVRSSVVLIEKSAVDSLRRDNELLRGQIEKLMSGFKEEVDKVRSGLQLDLNLEKSRIKEEATGLEQQIKDTNNAIDKEVAQLKTQIESQKLESIKYLAGGIFSIVTIILSVVLGLWRLLK